MTKIKLTVPPDQTPAEEAALVARVAASLHAATGETDITFELEKSEEVKVPGAIGDRMSDAGVSWAWYSGGWDDAEAGHPDGLFQFHHQPLNYYASFAPGTPARAQHLRDETEFEGQLADSKTKSCKLKPVSFVKPIGAENEHPGYASEHSGSDHTDVTNEELLELPVDILIPAALEGQVTEMNAAKVRASTSSRRSSTCSPDSAPRKASVTSSHLVL